MFVARLKTQSPRLQSKESKRYQLVVLHHKKRKLENRLSKIEEQIEKNEEIKAKAESDMLDEKIATSSVKLQEVCNLHAETEKLLSELYEEWEEIEEKLSEFN